MGTHKFIKAFIIFTAVLLMLAVSAPRLFAPAAVTLAAYKDDVRDQIPKNEANATPIVDENGNTIAFEVKEDPRPNVSAGTVMMIIFFAVCLFFCVEAVVSAVKKYRKNKKDMFDSMRE